MSQSPTKQVFTVLMADDDDDDVMLIEKAFKECELPHKLIRVADGEELTDYLSASGVYTGQTPKKPSMILLDLNMPKKDGREALAEIKTHAELRSIPIVIFTTSKADEDIIRSYQLGVNSFITKPVAYKQLIEVVKSLSAYWFDTVELPRSQ